MLLSVATANLFFRPFENVVDVIAEAGFQNIELDLYWERKTWAMAQHLKDVPAKQVIHWVEQCGLKVSSIHDGGGVLAGANSIRGYINPNLDDYLQAMGYAPECLVFHTPHVEGDPGPGWWERTTGQITGALEPYRKAGTWVTVENMPFFAGYFVPLTMPETLYAFAVAHGLNVTLDTTHYAQIGTDIVAAGRILQDRIKTVHLSDFIAGRSHVFIGEGVLDLAGFFQVIGQEQLNAVTLECSLSSPDRPAQEMGYDELVARMRAARAKVQELLGILG